MIVDVPPPEYWRVLRFVPPIAFSEFCKTVRASSLVICADAAPAPKSSNKARTLNLRAIGPPARRRSDRQARASALMLEPEGIYVKQTRRKSRWSNFVVHRDRSVPPLRGSSPIVVISQRLRAGPTH